MLYRGIIAFVSLVFSGSLAQAAFEQHLGPLAESVQRSLLKGWTASEQDDWFTLRNESASGSEQTLYLNAGQPPETGRITSAYVVVNSDRPNAAIGITLGNRANKSLCLLEITASKSVSLFCTENEKRREIATLPNLAKLDGSDIIKVIEVPGAARFILNDQKIGDVEDSPALGSEVGIMAYDIGTFGIAEFKIDANVATTQTTTATPPGGLPPRNGKGGTGPAQPAPTAAQPTSNGDNSVPGAGPLPRFGGDSIRMVSVYIGLAQSIFMHEFGHALIGELQLPSTGPEEDAVDVYAALKVVEPTMYPSSNKDINEMANGTATYAALQWYYSGKLAEMKGTGSSPWQDEHTTDLKRFRNMLCIMYGGNPKIFEPLTQSVGFEERTKARCGDEFNKQNRAWRRILAPNTRIGTWQPEGEQPANTPGAAIDVVFEPSQRRVGNLFANNFSDALKNHIKLLGDVYVLPRPLKVVFKDCGELNAWYSPREGSITMCYDLMEHIAVMISDIEMGTVGGEATAPESTTTTPVARDNKAPAENTAAPSGPFDELEDLGVPQTSLLFPAPYKGATPNYHPQGKVVKTIDVIYMLKKGKKVLLVDTSGLRESIPGAFTLPDAGTDGSVTDRLQAALDAWLIDKTKGDRDVSIVFFGRDMKDRSSYNAALRGGSLGWPTYWYRGGLEAWVANGVQTGAPQ